MLVWLHKVNKYLLKNPGKRNKLILITTIISLIFNILLWIILYLRLKPLAEIIDKTTIPLHYNIYFGVDLLGPWTKSLRLPLSGLMILIINYLLALIIYSKKLIISYFLTITSLLVQLIFLVSGVLIILMNL